MSYYVRAFCIGPRVPSLADVLMVFQSDDEIDLQITIEDELEIESPDWTNCELTFDQKRQPIVIECNRDDGSESLCRIESAEFIEDLEGLDESPSRDSVIEHLRKSRFIVACELPDDITDAGYAVTSRFLNYFVERSGGLIQADDEGFYQDGSLIVETS